MSTVATKSMTLGEGGTALAFVALAALSLIVLGQAHTPEYGFHAFGANHRWVAQL
jgi:cytochrome c oxidase cbb3-type subunit I